MTELTNALSQHRPRSPAVATQPKDCSLMRISSSHRLLLLSSYGIDGEHGQEAALEMVSIRLGE